MIFYFYLVSLFSISYSVLPFHLVCFLISPYFLFSDILSQALIKLSRIAFVYIYINDMYSLCILENLFDLT